MLLPRATRRPVLWGLVALTVWTTTTSDCRILPTVHAWKFKLFSRRRGTGAGSTTTSGESGGGGEALLPSTDASTLSSTKYSSSSAPSPSLESPVPPSQVQRLNNMIPDFLHSVSQTVWSLVLYKPPVGIVGLLGFARLVWTGRLFGQEPPKQQPTATAVRKKSLHLDPDDQAYQQYGGVERIRRKLCLAALQNDDNTTATTVASADLQYALQIYQHPGRSRMEFLRQIMEPLAVVEGSAVQYPQTFQGDPLWHVSKATLQVRALDALVRVARDRLIQTAVRIQRQQQYWQRKVELSQRQRWFLRSKSDEATQRQLSIATAAYRAEVDRLGRIATVLLQRPDDLDESFLLEALHVVETKTTNTTAYDKGRWNFQSWTEQLNRLYWQPLKKGHWRQLVARHSRWNIQSWTERLNRLYWQPLKKGQWRQLVARHTTNNSTDISPDRARQVLVAAHDVNAVWLTQARAWTMEARSVLCDIVRETLPSDSTESWDTLEQAWCVNEYSKQTPIALLWSQMVHHVDALASRRRVGERSVVHVRDVFDWARRNLDPLGIPSTLLAVGAAHYVHTLVVPHWPTMKRDVIQFTRKALEITEERVWVPLKGIYNDIMNKNPGMMSAFGIDIEEASLDHMLRDLGCSDGTPATRREGLQKASELYEGQLKSGLVMNLARGGLIRSLLIQVQQLKVGLLSALDTIDVLLKGNRIHFQVLAAIPAVVMTYYGTQFFVRSLYNIRARDLRPITTVHAEMGQLLQEMERLIVLADPVEILSDTTSRVPVIRAGDLGELLLYIHRYLLLLDYTTPPFPSWHGNHIQQSLHALLGTDGTLMRQLGTDRHLAWLHLIQKKHQELLKHL